MSTVEPGYCKDDPKLLPAAKFLKTLSNLGAAYI